MFVVAIITEGNKNMNNDEVITLSGNMEPPLVCIDTAKACYHSIEKTDEFDVAKFNGLLMAVVTYLDHHNIDYGDKALPWAELVKSA